MRFVWLALVLGCGGGANTGPAVANTAPTSQPPVIDDREAVEDVSVQVRKLAFEGYPQWSVAHPSEDCPTSLAVLLEYFEDMTTRDPWGTELRMHCGPALPPGVQGIGVQSAGPDRKFDSADDVKSWE